MIINRLIALLLALVLPVSGFGQGYYFARPASAPAATYLISENFDGAGTPTSWTVTGTGTSNFDYTTSPAPLEGTQSYRASTATQTIRCESINISDATEVYCYVLFRPVTFSANTRNFIGFENSGGGTIYPFIRNSAGTIEVSHGGASATTVGSMSAGTTYHVWFYWKAKVGAADGVAWIGWSTDGTRPTSGNNFQQVTAGTSSSTAVRAVILGVAPDDSNVTQELIWDKLRVDDVTIGDNPS